MAFSGHLWQNMGLIWLLLSSFLAVIDPNSFGLVKSNIRFFLTVNVVKCRYDLQQCKIYNAVLLPNMTYSYILYLLKRSRFCNPDRWFWNWQSHCDLLTKLRLPILIRSRKKDHRSQSLIPHSLRIVDASTILSYLWLEV